MSETGSPSARELGINAGERKNPEQLKRALADKLMFYMQAPAERVGAVAPELTETFEVGSRSDKDVLGAVRDRLKSRGVSISDQEYRISKQLLLRIHQWLSAAEGPAKDRAYKNANTNEQKVIDCFKSDRITTWEEAARLLAAPVGEIAEVKTVKFEESDDGVADDLEKANERLWGKIAELETTNVDLRSKLQQLEEENGQLQNRIDELGEKNEKLRAQLDSEEGGVITGDDIAGVIESVRGDQRELLLAQLPKEFDWEQEKGTITYKEGFIRDLLLLESKERGRIVRALEQFRTSIMGRNGSFQTKKLERQVLNSPPGSYASRATHKLRFTWTKSKGAITILEMYGRGDSRVGYSEA